MLPGTSRPGGGHTFPHFSHFPAIIHEFRHLPGTTFDAPRPLQELAEWDSAAAAAAADLIVVRVFFEHGVDVIERLLDDAHLGVGSCPGHQHVRVIVPYYQRLHGMHNDVLRVKQESLALASMARDDPPASSTASSTAPASSTAAAIRNLKPKLAIMRHCTSVTDRRTDRQTDTGIIA